MNTITFMRHGLVENPEDIIYGELPGFPLAKEGRAEVEARARKLSRYPYERIIASPQDRAQETADIVRRTAFPQLKVETDERLREWVYISQGLTREEWHTKYAHIRAQYKKDAYKTPAVVDGQRFETFSEMEVRLRSFTDEYQAKGLTLAISHGDPIMVIVAALLNEKYQDLKDRAYVATAETRTLNFDDGRVVLSDYPQ